MVGVSGSLALPAIADNTDETGVYGFADMSANSTGVWGDSNQGTGVAGSGDWGVFGTGAIGVYGHAATSTAYGLYTTGSYPDPAWLTALVTPMSMSL